MGKKTWAAIGAVLVIGAIAVVGVSSSAAAVDDAYRRGRADSTAASEAAAKGAMKSQFDKGMKAGVEYQTWFCEHPAAEQVPGH
jgi:hypothetical protein